ncbi:MAG TPA: hypothetical protein VD999_01180 [Vitreimonas sp.]|nr:hypothetical protein [Vitreimonas sp.]
MSHGNQEIINQAIAAAGSELKAGRAVAFQIADVVKEAQLPPLWMYIDPQHQNEPQVMIEKPHSAAQVPTFLHLGEALAHFSRVAGVDLSLWSAYFAELTGHENWLKPGHLGNKQRQSVVLDVHPEFTHRVGINKQADVNLVQVFTSYILEVGRLPHIPVPATIVIGTTEGSLWPANKDQAQHKQGIKMQRQGVYFSAGHHLLEKGGEANFRPVNAMMIDPGRRHHTWNQVVVFQQPALAPTGTAELLK